jgi:hypothetical protein
MRGSKRRDVGDPSGVPNRERRGAMDSVTGTFGNEGKSF